MHQWKQTIQKRARVHIFVQSASLECATRSTNHTKTHIHTNTCSRVGHSTRGLGWSIQDEKTHTKGAILGPTILVKVGHKTEKCHFYCEMRICWKQVNSRMQATCLAKRSLDCMWLECTAGLVCDSVSRTCAAPHIHEYTYDRFAWSRFRARALLQ